MHLQGKAVAGANVVVDETDLGAAADEDGKFTIEGVSVWLRRYCVSNWLR